MGKPDKDNTLQLIIKQEFFDQIIAGTKKEEYREIKPTTEKKLVQLDSEGYAIEDENGNSMPIRYDYIKFYVGYAKERDWALVEVIGSHTEMFMDDNDKPISYDYNGEKYFAEQIVYHLGNVIEVHRK